MKEFNPWNLECLECGTILQANRWVTISYLLAIPIGVAVAGIALYLEETNNWGTRELMLFYASMFFPALAISLYLWRHWRFEVKSNA